MAGQDYYPLDAGPLPNPVPLKESTVRGSEEALHVSALKVVDSATAGELPWFEAEPGLSSVEVCKVAQGKTSR